MAGINVATLFVSVVAETSKLAPSIRKGLSSADADGRRAGQQIGTGLSGGVSKGVKGASGAVDKELKNAGKGADTAGKNVGGRFGAGFKSAAGMLTAVAGLAVVQKGFAFLKDSVGVASALAESGNKVEQVFGKASPAIVAYADKSAKSLGVATLAARESAANFGIFGKAAGLTGQPLSDFSTGLVTLASDLASFSDTSPEQAVTALTAALRGEALPMRAYGVLLDEATLKSRALSMGLVKGAADESKIAVIRVRAQAQLQKYNAAVKKFGAGSIEAKTAQAQLAATQSSLAKAVKGTVPPLTQQQRVLAAQAEVMAQTKDAQGDFARTSDGLANAQRVLAAQFENVKAKIGSALLPAIESVVGFLNEKAFPAFDGLGAVVGTTAPAFKLLGSALAFMAPALPPLVAGFVAYKAVTYASAAASTAMAAALKVQTLWTGKATVAQKLLSLAQGMSPIGLLVAGLVALGVGLVMAYKHSETFRKIVDATWTGIKDVAAATVQWFTGTAWPAITGFLTSVGEGFGKFAGVVSKAWDSVKAAWSGVAGWFASSASAIAAGVSAAWAGVGTAMGAVGGFLKGAAAAAVGAYIRYVVGVFNVFKTAATATWGAVKTVIETVLFWLKGIAVGIVTVAVLLLERPFWGLVKTVTTAWDGVKKATQLVLSWFTGTVGPAFQKVLDFSRLLFEKFSYAATRVWGGVTAAASVAVNWYRDKVSPIIETVVARLIYAFENMRAKVVAAWVFVRAGIDAVVNWFQKNVLPVLSTALMWLWVRFDVFKQKVIASWNAVVAAITTVVNWFKTVVVTAFTTALAVILSKFEAFKRGVKVIWDYVSAVILAVANWFRSVIVNAFTTALAVVTARFQAFRNSMSAIWAFIRAVTNAAVGWITGTALPTMTRSFTNTVAAISKAWSGIKEAIAAPLRWVVDKALRPFVAKFNDISKMVNGPTLPMPSFSGGGAVLARNRGGVIPGRYPGPGRDNTWGMIGGRAPVQLAGQEWIIQGSTARGYGPRVMSAINEGRIPRKLLEQLASGRGLSYGGQAGMAGGGAVYQQMAAWLRGNMPWTRVSSGYRPGSITSSGNRSFHSMGKALDVVPTGRRGLMDVFNQIYASWARSAAEIIYTPARGRQIKNGRPYIYGGQVARDHYDHVHWAMQSMGKGATPGDMLSLVLGPIGTILGGLLDPAKSVIMQLFAKMPGKGAAKDVAKLAGTKLVTAGFDKLKSLDQVMLGDLTDNKRAQRDVSQGGGSVQAKVRAVASRFGWGSGPNWDALQWIIQRESGWNPTAKNPSSSAYGLPQALPGSKMASAGADWRTNPSTQALWMMRYIGDRYRTPIGAQAFWRSHNWYNEGGPVASAVDAGGDVMKYDAGGMLRYGDVGVHLRKTPDAVLTGRQWSDVRRYLPGQGGAGGRSTVAEYHFHGDVYEEAMVKRFVRDQERAKRMADFAAGVN